MQVKFNHKRKCIELKRAKIFLLILLIVSIICCLIINIDSFLETFSTSYIFVIVNITLPCTSHFVKDHQLVRYISGNRQFTSSKSSPRVCSVFVLSYCVQGSLKILEVNKTFSIFSSTLNQIYFTRQPRQRPLSFDPSI